MYQISNLPELIALLPADRRARFERIFHVDAVAGRCVIPDTMRAWTEDHFGSVAEVETQTVVRVTNLVTWDGALFNPLRNRRPVLSRQSSADSQPSPEDVFADPLRTTAADTFGRARGEHCVTASNVARWDGQCGVLIFDEPDPLAFTRDHIRDYFRASLAWARRAHDADPDARYFVWMWNGGAAGGASVLHAHAQLGLGRRRHYARVEGLRRAALDYRERHAADYFADLLAAHADVGLAFQTCGLDGFVYLAPIKNKETWVFGHAFDDPFADAFHDTLRALVDRAGVRAFDAAILMPPLFGPLDEDWSRFPVIARIIDRGRPEAVSSDFGALDVFAHSVITHDPFAVRAALAL